MRLGWRLRWLWRCAPGQGEEVGVLVSVVGLAQKENKIKVNVDCQVVRYPVACLECRPFAGQWVAGSVLVPERFGGESVSGLQSNGWPSVGSSPIR